MSLTPDARLPIWQDVPFGLGHEPEDIPDLTVYRPSKPTGASFIICPGGGYTQLVAHEKDPVVLWMIERGITAFRLKYRLRPRYDFPAPMLDAAESVRLVRARAQELGVDPGRIGMIGFSAGGHLAAHTGARFDSRALNKVSRFRTTSSRPDLLVLIYPVIDMVGAYALTRSAQMTGEQPTLAQLKGVSPHLHVTEKTPPAFLVHSTLDDRVSSEHSMLFAMALRRHGVAHEVHLYERGGHGFGGSPMAPKDEILATWLVHLEAWLKGKGYC
jgi:acetyl esterase/lipase